MEVFDFAVENPINKILDCYDIKVNSIEEIKYKDSRKPRAVYHIFTDKSEMCLKKVCYPEGELLFIYSATEWLNLNNINCPKLYNTKKKLKYVKHYNELYTLTEWINGRKADYDRMGDIESMAYTLGCMHRCSSGFTPIPGSTIKQNKRDYFKANYKRFLQLFAFHEQALRIRDKFSEEFLKHDDYYITSAWNSLKTLSRIDIYNLKDTMNQNTLCHLDFVNKNIIFDNNEKLYIIDFDNSAFDMPVQDLCYFLRRILRRESCAWDFKVFKSALDAYSEVRRPSKAELLCMLSLLQFPQRYWRLSKNYFLNKTNYDIVYLIKGIKELNALYKEHEEFCKKTNDYINSRDFTHD